MKELFTSMLQALSDGQSVVLCSILASSGSTPRGAGAKMAVFADGHTVGTIGGGAVEKCSGEKALEVLQSKQSLVQGYCLAPNQVADIGMICGGNVTVYFQYFDPADENGRALLQGILELLRGDDDSWLVYRMDGGCVSAMGTFDEAHGLRFTDCITPEALRPMLLSNSFTKKGDPGYYIEPLTQAGHAYIFGGGHVGTALAPVLASVGFRVVVYDNRPDFAKPDHYPSAEQVILGDYLDIGAHLTLTENDYVCIMTPGHQADREVLLQALRSPATYIGCIGSRHKIAATNAYLMANGIPEDVAASIYNEMYDFANYAFNKAHSVCYAVIAYQTAWFKCYYPREYMAALMTSVLDSSVKISEYIAECRAMDIALLPPDINESNDNFTVVPGGIRFGLAAIKNIGRGFILKVMDEREQHGKFTSLEDFALRMYGTDLNKRALENLIKAGACDGFGLNRAQMLRMYELIMDAAANQKSKNVEGQMGLFDLLSGEDAPAAMPAIPVPNIPELSAQEKMSLEKQTTGLYLSGHPMDDYRPLLRGMDVVPIGEILECFENGEDTYQDEQIVNIAGIVEAVKMKTTKSGSMMAYVTVEDDTGSMELLVFSGVLGQYGSMLYENSAVILNGRISVRDEKPPQLVVNRVLPIADMQDADVAQAARQAAAQAHTVYLRIEDSAQSSARKVFPVLKMFPGKAKAVVYYADSGARMGGKCAIDERMLREMRELLGEKNVIVK